MATDSTDRDVVRDDVLHESLDELYERAPCGYVITFPDGAIIRVNQTLLDWTGDSRDELLAGRRFPDLLTIPGRVFYESHVAPLLRMQGFVKEVALDLRRRDRDPMPVLVSSVQRTDAGGRPIVIASTVFDATDRRAYERELLRARRSAEQLATVVTASDDAIVTTTVDGTVLTWNPSAARLFGPSIRDPAGTRLHELLSLEGDGATWQPVWADLRASRAVHREAVVLHAGGRRTDVSVGLTPHPDLMGNLGAVSAIIRDIGARKETERLQRDFLAMATHELQTPVAGIRAIAQLMRRRGTYSEQAVDMIVTQTDRLAGLIGDLLLASQIEADRLDLHLQRTDLGDEVRVAVQTMTVGGLDVRLEAPAEPIVVSVDPHRLGQVFTNLLSNAVKYTPDGAQVVVRVMREGHEARVAVVDRGVGIPPSEVPHLFDRFYRVAGTTWAPGLGLGLYISRRIVEAHGGRIDVASEPGRGSAFTVALPLADDATSPWSSNDEPATA